jgi:hypothetical protein
MTDTMKLRLALRAEGTLWNAYIAPVGTMKGAVHIGSIGMGVVQANPHIKTAFMVLMQEAMTAAIAQVSSIQPETRFEIHRAPEHERAGHA